MCEVLLIAENSFFLVSLDEVPLFKLNFTIILSWILGHVGDSSIEAANADARDITL